MASVDVSVEVSNECQIQEVTLDGQEIIAQYASLCCLQSCLASCHIACNHLNCCQVRPKFSDIAWCSERPSIESVSPTKWQLGLNFDKCVTVHYGRHIDNTHSYLLYRYGSGEKVVYVTHQSSI